MKGQLVTSRKEADKVEGLEGVVAALRCALEDEKVRSEALTVEHEALKKEKVKGEETQVMAKEELLKLLQEAQEENKKLKEKHKGGVSGYVSIYLVICAFTTILRHHTTPLTTIIYNHTNPQSPWTLVWSSNERRWQRSLRQREDTIKGWWRSMRDCNNDMTTCMVMFKVSPLLPLLMNLISSKECRWVTICGCVDDAVCVLVEVLKLHYLIQFLV